MNFTWVKFGSFTALCFLVSVAGARAEHIANPVAVFTGLDKITGRTQTFDVAVGQEKAFGGLVLKADVCYTRSITEEPKTTAFVEVWEVLRNKERKKIFSGWMFAQSPGLNAVEHAVYDAWLINCRDPNAPPPPVEEAPVVKPPDDPSKEGKPAGDKSTTGDPNQPQEEEQPQD